MSLRLSKIKRVYARYKIQYLSIKKLSTGMYTAARKKSCMLGMPIVLNFIPTTYSNKPSFMIKNEKGYVGMKISNWMDLVKNDT